ncbi:hypothetical protein Q3C01_01115 [Bradyrhizobium sp. UFLA05-109]
MTETITATVQADIPTVVDTATASSPPPSIHQQADTLRSQLIANPEFRSKHLAGDLASRRQMAALDSIRISDPNADPAALKALAEQAGIIEMPRPAAAPPVSALAAPGPKPTDYPVYWGNTRNELGADSFNVAVEESTTFASAMKFAPAFGKAVIEHLVEAGARFKTMEPERRTMWVIEQQSRGMMSAGGPEAYEALKADAAKALDLAGNHPWSKLLRDPAAPISHDVWLLQTLANYWRSHQRAPGKGQ